MMLPDFFLYINMKNIGITKVMKWGVDDFTSPAGLMIRCMINPVFRRLLRFGTRRKIVIEQYPKLERGQPYIFSATHSFDDDIISTLSAIDRNAYVLIGTTDQIEYNPQMYAGWLNGMIYVDRLDPQSRKDSVSKMVKVLKHGTSVLIFPEGGWNNTENLLVQPLFSGPYLVHQETGCPVVPIAAFHEHNSDKIYIRAGQPMSFENMDKHESLDALRDAMASMVYEMVEAHCTPLKRDDLRGTDFHMAFMEERRLEYLRVRWSRDVWDEELTFYQDKEYPRPEMVWAFIDRVVVHRQNAIILASILLRREVDKQYDFKEYMHHNWDRK